MRGAGRVWSAGCVFYLLWRPQPWCQLVRKGHRSGQVGTVCPSVWRMRSMLAILILVHTLYSSRLSHPSIILSSWGTPLNTETCFVPSDYFRESRAVILEAGRRNELGCVWTWVKWRWADAMTSFQAPEPHAFNSLSQCEGLGHPSPCQHCVLAKSWRSFSYSNSAKGGSSAEDFLQRNWKWAIKGHFVVVVVVYMA